MRKKDQLTFILLGVGLVVVIIVGFFLFKGNTQTAPEGYQIYKSDKDHYSLIYPEDWLVSPPVPGVSSQFIAKIKNLRSKPLPIPESVNIVVDNLEKSPKQLDQYTDTAINQVRVVFKDNIDVIESKPTQLSGQPAYLFSYIVKFPGKGNLKMKHIWTIVNNKGYQFTCAGNVSTFDLYSDSYDRMIESFKITR
ncbi:MAG: hypothetical protein HQL26_01405 [Candidatus Omnitrophica bacterium]|nr:hypothetical protein [Candidatus Omnitrophota bacterium]